ncbi:hypothetical protein EAI_05506 [Harpegnathos saltator]|uniref:Uncharacterized protein n=1 Tax=Harpegnathos saltator TaxID=610380 RepID=E2BSD3_HARSA|nr:hypothetical protein EAI_05506 [Harpegnathos saltator]
MDDQLSTSGIEKRKVEAQKFRTVWRKCHAKPHFRLRRTCCKLSITPPNGSPNKAIGKDAPSAWTKVASGVMFSQNLQDSSGDESINRLPSPKEVSLESYAHLKNKSWFHSEPALHSIRRLTQIPTVKLLHLAESAVQDIAERVQKNLEHYYSSDEEFDLLNRANTATQIDKAEIAPDTSLITIDKYE